MARKKKDKFNDYVATENYQQTDEYAQQSEYENYDEYAEYDAEQYGADWDQQDGECQHVDAEVAETVMKSIGSGAVPISTPSQIIQLQPIVVPIAIVPFASQNQKVVQYGNEQAQESPTTTQDTTNFYAQAQRNKAVNRKKSFVLTVFSLIFILPFVLAYFKPNLVATFLLTDLDVLGKIKYFIGGAQFVISGEIVFLLLSFALGLALICFLVALISSVIGKYSKIGMLILSVFPALFSVGATLYAFVPSFNFIAWNKIAFILPAAIGVLQTISAAVFAIGKKN